MQSKATSPGDVEPRSGTLAGDAPGWAGKRELLRDSALRSALEKRAVGVPTYSVPETAALMSISAEYLYRLIQAAEFPAIRIRVTGTQGKFVVPAKAVEQLLEDATTGGRLVEVSEWTARWAAERTEVPA